MNPFSACRLALVRGSLSLPLSLATALGAHGDGTSLTTTSSSEHPIETVLADARGDQPAETTSVSALPFVQMNEQVYKEKPGDVEGWHLLKGRSDLRIDEHGLISMFPSLQAGVYTKNDHAHVTVVFRGTSEKADWLTNAAWAMDHIPVQHLLASSVVAQVQQAFPDSSIALTGHSLGGGLATFVGIELGLPAVTFNALGINRVMKRIFKERLSGQAERTVALTSSGSTAEGEGSSDILTQIFAPFGRHITLPTGCQVQKICHSIDTFNPSVMNATTKGLIDRQEELICSALAQGADCPTTQVKKAIALASETLKPGVTKELKLWSKGGKEIQLAQDTPGDGFTEHGEVVITKSPDSPSESLGLTNAKVEHDKLVFSPEDSQSARTIVESLCRSRRDLRAMSGWHVALTATADADTFTVDDGKDYKKGKKLSSYGNCAYLQIGVGERTYLACLTGLESVSCEVGPIEGQGLAVGSVGPESSIRIWRIGGREDRFLNTSKATLISAFR